MDRLQKVVLGKSHLDSLSLNESLPLALTPEPLLVDFSGFEKGGVLILDSYLIYREALRNYVSSLPSKSPLLIVLTDPKEMKLALEDQMSSPIFEHPGVDFACVLPNESVDPRRYLEVWKKKSPSIRLRLLRDPRKGQSEYLLPLFQHLENLQRYVVMELSSQAGSVADEFEGLSNSIKNIPEMLKSPDLRKSRGVFQGTPAFVLGAGPSLDEDLDFIRAHQDEALVIAADTLYRKTKEFGLKVDIFVGIERSAIVTELIRGGPEQDSFYFAALVVPPDCFKEFHGNRSVFLQSSPYNTFFSFKRVVTDVGHSCIGGALAVAKHLGCGPVAICGVDLCFDQKMETHSRVSPYKEKEFEGVKDQFDAWRREAVPALDRAGRKVNTHMFWLKYRDEFERIIASTPDRFVISDRGLPIAGTQYLNREAASEVFRNSKMKSDHLRRFESSLPYERHDECLEDLSRVQGNLIRLQEILKDASAQVERAKLSELPAIISSLEFSSNFFAPLFKVALNRIKEGDSEVQDRERSEIVKHWKLLRELLDDELPKLEECRARAQRRELKLY